MNASTPDYKPGDIANGHILTEHGWVPTAPAPAPEAPKAKKPIYKRWWVIALAAIVAIGVLSQAASGSDEDKAEAPQQEAAQTAPKADKPSGQPKAEKPAPAEDEAPAMTAAQENAVGSAEDYLEFSSFSRKGLIEQLRFEGYSNKDAAFAVDAISPNWNEQAAGSAEDYIDTSGFSREGLIEQLKFEGYTQQQAEHGVNAISPNWNEQAARSAKEYLDTSHFSRSGLIEQLKFEGYTQQQAEYGVNKAGL
jgi:hypothetical protein